MPKEIVTFSDLMNYKNGFDKKLFDETTENDIRRHMIEDGEDPDASLDSERFTVVSRNANSKEKSA